MRSFGLFLLFWLRLIAGVYSQSLYLDPKDLELKPYFRKDYQTAERNFDHALASGKTRNGKFYLDNKLKDNQYFSYDYYSLDPASDYYIEMVFEWVKGDKRYGNGLTFNYNTSIKSNYYTFILSPNQAFRISKVVNDVYADVTDWTAFGKTHTTGLNTLGLLGKGEKMYFYINNHLAYEMKRPPYLGSNVGFVLAQQSGIAVESFSILYNPPKVKAIPSARKSYKKINAGKAINTAGEEFYPVVSADGKMMTFTRAENPGVVSLDTRVLYYSEKDHAGNWKKAKPFPSTINKGGAPQVVYISPDKQRIVINGTYDAAGNYVKDQGLAVSYRTEGSWTRPENVEIEGFENLNLYETYCFSVSDNVMILSVQTPEGFGEKDLYVSFRKGNKWSKPVNMGKRINSWAEEFSPCLAPDDVTLYYSSGGKPGYGREDIFMTKRLDDTWLNWSEPLNLGPELNTRFSDAGLQLDAYGDYAYINHDFKTNSEGDVATFLLPEAAKPGAVMIVQGKVLNKLTGQPVKTKVVCENMDKQKQNGFTHSAKKDGSFTLVLPYMTNYSIYPELKGWLCESRNILLKDSTQRKTSETEAVLYVVPLKVGELIPLQGIFFKINESEMLPSSFTELNRLCQVMKQHPGMVIELGGHTDPGTKNSKDEELNALSLKRAEEIKKYLVAKGNDESRIRTKGYGKTRPISEIKAQNRRVEVKIIRLK